jgi:toxin ParE1/3/4
MPRIRWTTNAYTDLRTIIEYITEDDEAAAGRIGRRLWDAIRRLTAYPGMGREGRVAGTRELVVPATPYIVAYRIVGATVEILAILHGARRWPDSF